MRVQSIPKSLTYHCCISLYMRAWKLEVNTRLTNFSFLYCLTLFSLINEILHLMSVFVVI